MFLRWDCHRGCSRDFSHRVMSESSRKTAPAVRAQRLSVALRENLKRRKAQARRRSAAKGENSESFGKRGVTATKEES